MQIVLIVLGLVIGCILMYFVLQPKLKKTQKYNINVEEQNKVLQHDKECYEQEIKTLRNTSSILQEELGDTRAKIAGLYAKEKQLQDHIEKTRETIDKDNEIIYQKSFDLMQEKLSQAAEKEADKFQEAQKIAEEEYLRALEILLQKLRPRLLQSARRLELRKNNLRLYERKPMPQLPQQKEKKK